MDKKEQAAFNAGVAAATSRNIKVWAIERAVEAGHQDAGAIIKSARVFEKYVNEKLSRRQ